MKRVFLVGYMGAGKTTVGRDLAKRVGLSFIDLDAYIEGRYHKTIRELFLEKGEDNFREIEQKMLHEVAMFEDVLIATGGGAPCFYDNMEFMNKAGKTIYLKVSVEELAKRLELFGQNRPILSGKSGKDLEEFIAQTLEKREPYYGQASVIFDAEIMLTTADIQNISTALEKII